MALEDTTPTYVKMHAMKDAIANLRVRDKRAVFLLMRTASDQLNVDTFFPLQGFTAGEFAVGQVLAENNRKPLPEPTTTTRGTATTHTAKPNTTKSQTTQSDAAKPKKKKPKTATSKKMDAKPNQRLMTTRSKPAVAQ